jgi:nucleotide-binding universal stress UspA family protein
MVTTLSESLDCALHVVYVEGHLGDRLGDRSCGTAEVSLDSGFDEWARRRLERDAWERLEGQAESIRSWGAEVAGAHTRIGHPDAEIVELAEELGAGLVVVGSRGLGPLKRAVMGSVADSVVRHAPCSVLVVRGDGREDERPLPGRILVPVDGSQGAKAAARSAAEIAAATGSELHLHHVVPREGLLPVPGPEAWEVSEAELRRREGSARSFLKREAKRVGAGVAEEVHVGFGEPDREIVELAHELGAGLIAMGSRGLGGIGRALLGSVSDSVVRHAHCPVLVVRDRG